MTVSVVIELNNSIWFAGLKYVAVLNSSISELKFSWVMHGSIAKSRIKARNSIMCTRLL